VAQIFPKKALSFRRTMLLLMLFMQLLLSSASADIPVEGKTDYDINYVITNIDQYQDYAFLTSSQIWGWEYADLINQSTGTFGGGYKFDYYILHAILASKFDLVGFKADPEEYAKNNTLILTSEVSLPKKAQVDDTLKLDSIVVYLKIDSITHNSFNVSKTGMIYNYKDGRSQRVPLGDQS
jgi:hypothetical protein